MKTSNGDARPSVKVLLHVRSLHIGGTERQVVSLSKSMAALGAEVLVATVVSGGPLERDLVNVPNVRVHALGRGGLVGKLQYLFRLRSLIKSEKFDAVYGFLPTPNLALLVARTVRRRPLIAWGVRSSNLDLSQYNSRVKWAMRLEKWLSVLADRVITNSQAALDEYRQSRNGYPQSKLTHIPNAIDVDRFRPDPDARESVQTELGIFGETRLGEAHLDETTRGETTRDETPLIGLLARLHPMKDHLTFLRAASLFVENTPGARFICAGGTAAGYSNYERRIKASATEMGLNDNVLWLGPRSDPERLMAACDITTLTSDSGEGFPNSVAESMACGTPCVVTDVGDTAKIVGRYGAVVPRSDPAKLAEAWKELIERQAERTNNDTGLARQSIIDRYSPANIARTTLDLIAR